MTRWTLTDPTTNESWRMPINPDKMTSPWPTRQLKTAFGIRRQLERARTFEEKPVAVRWEWQGVINTEAHYDAYVTWASKPGLIRVADHLGRTWEVLFESFEPEERRPSGRTGWRFRYTAKCLIIRRVS